jgi:hypothetical protein
VENEELAFVYCEWEDNISDFTKALRRSLFEKCLAGMGML